MIQIELSFMACDRLTIVLNQRVYSMSLLRCYLKNTYM